MTTGPQKGYEARLRYSLGLRKKYDQEFRSQITFKLPAAALSLFAKSTCVFTINEIDWDSAHLSIPIKATSSYNEQRKANRSNWTRQASLPARSHSARRRLAIGILDELSAR